MVKYYNSGPVQNILSWLRFYAAVGVFCTFGEIFWLQGFSAPSYDTDHLFNLKLKDCLKQLFRRVSPSYD